MIDYLKMICYNRFMKQSPFKGFSRDEIASVERCIRSCSKMRSTPKKRRNVPFIASQSNSVEDPLRNYTLSATSGDNQVRMYGSLYQVPLQYGSPIVSQGINSGSTYQDIANQYQYEATASVVSTDPNLIPLMYSDTYEYRLTSGPISVEILTSIMASHYVTISKFRLSPELFRSLAREVLAVSTLSALDNFILRTAYGTVQIALL